MEQVLIIDDHREIGHLLAERFTKGGVPSFYAVDGEEAVRVLRERSNAGRSPQICLIDVIMPGLHGVKLMKAIKDINPGIRIMLMTGYTDMPEITEMTNAGIVDIFYKPFRIEEVLAKINFVLSNTQRIAT